MKKSFAYAVLAIAVVYTLPSQAQLAKMIDYEIVSNEELSITQKQNAYICDGEAVDGLTPDTFTDTYIDRDCLSLSNPNLESRSLDPQLADRRPYFLSKIVSFFIAKKNSIQVDRLTLVTSTRGGIHGWGEKKFEWFAKVGLSQLRVDQLTPWQKVGPAEDSDVRRLPQFSIRSHYADKKHDNTINVPREVHLRLPVIRAILGKKDDKAPITLEDLVRTEVLYFMTAGNTFWETAMKSMVAFNLAVQQKINLLTEDKAYKLVMDLNKNQLVKHYIALYKTRLEDVKIAIDDDSKEANNVGYCGNDRRSYTEKLNRLRYEQYVAAGMANAVNQGLRGGAAIFHEAFKDIR